MLTYYADLNRMNISICINMKVYWRKCSRPAYVFQIFWDNNFYELPISWSHKNISGSSMVKKTETAKKVND